MSFNIADIIIIIVLLLGFITGYEKGLIKQGVSTLGIIVCLVLAFLFKDNLSIVLYKNLPFFTIGLLKNYSSLNILIYELMSFLMIFSILGILLALIIKFSGIIEMLVESTIILKLPSKILGGLLGFIEMYIALFIILLIIAMPIFNNKFTDELSNSTLKDYILNNTLLISNISKPLVNTIDEIDDLFDIKKVGSKEFNCNSIKILMKNKIINEENINYLKENNKIEYNVNNCK